MPSTTATAASVLTPAQVEQLVVLPLISHAVAFQVSNVVQVNSHQLRVPRITADPTASWTAEGSEINVSDPVLDEVDITPAALKGLVVITNELAADSSPSALQIVGDGLVRDLARKVDQAYFGSTAANTPSGLLSITPSAVDAGDSWTNLDAFEAAKSIAEQHNTVVDNFVCSPSTALTLATLKEYGTAGSNRALLQPDPTQPTRRTIAGVPLLTSPTIGANIVWGIPKSRVVLALRQGTSVSTDGSVFYTSDRTAVRAIVRCSWGFIEPLAISKINITP